MGEDARVARLRHVDTAHSIRDCDAAVCEGYAIGSFGPSSLGVCAVEVDEEFFGLRVPFCIWRGDMWDAVLAGPNV